VSTNQERDADMDRLLRAVLRPGAHPQDGECPDAAALAAFIEGGLSKDEQAALDAHIAQCGRCQEALAVIGRDGPAQVPVPAPVVRPERSKWFTWVTMPRLRWLVPVTAVATVAVFFFATRPLIAPGGSTAPGEATQLARATPEAEHAPQVERTPEPGAAAPAAAAPEAPAATAADIAKDARKSELADRLTAASRSEPMAGADRQPSRMQRPGGEPATPAQVAEAAPAAPAVPLGQAAPETKGTAIVVGQAAPGTKEAVEKTRNIAARADADEKRTRAAQQPPPEAPPAPALAPPEYAAKGTVVPAGATPAAGAVEARPSAVAIQSDAGLRSSQLAAGVVLAPQGVVRWRLSAGGRIWRSADAGQTWRLQVSGVSADLVAGSAPGPTICWAVGAGGTVIRSVDGERWERLPFPLPVDLVGVRATDARSAIVTTRDGRRLETLDGGATWSPK
jgi:hypothetical protein